MILIGTFVVRARSVSEHGIGRRSLAALGVILAAVYMLSVVQKMFFGPLTNPKNQRLTDLNARETLALAPLVALVFVIGFFPNIFLEPHDRERRKPCVDRFNDGRAALYALGPDATEPVADAPARRTARARATPKHPEPAKRRAGAAEQALNQPGGAAVNALLACSRRFSSSRSARCS